MRSHNFYMTSTHHITLQITLFTISTTFPPTHLPLIMSVPVTGKSGNETRATALEQQYEIRPDPVALTQNPDPSQNSSTGVDYEPHPKKSIKLDPQREKIVQAICNLYSGSASKEDMMVYAEEAIYDDPWSYCDTRYKIAGQWYGTYQCSETSDAVGMKEGLLM
jgi:hypothetical protein